MDMRIRQFIPSDGEVVLQLNAASVALLSPLDGERLAWLDALACFHVVAEQDAGVVGFLLAFADGVPYNSVNYH